LNFVKSTARASGTQGLEHIGFKVTTAKLNKTRNDAQRARHQNRRPRGDDAFYFSDPNGYQIEYYLRLKARSLKSKSSEQTQLIFASDAEVLRRQLRPSLGDPRLLRAN